MGLSRKIRELFPAYLRDYRHRHQALLARDAAIVAAGNRRHLCLAHVWGDEAQPGAQLLCYAMGDAAETRSVTPVTVEGWQALPAGTPIAVQIQGVRKTFTNLASREPHSAIHYISYYSGFGRPGFDDLRRGGWLRGTIAQQVALTNNGAPYDSEWLWKRAKQDVITQCAMALDVLSLPSHAEDRELSAIKDQLKKYRFTRTAQQAEGAFAVADSDRDHLVIALALGVLKLQRERWRKKTYLPSSFDRFDNDNDGLPPLMTPIRLF